MTQNPKVTPIPVEYTDEGEPITVVVTCHNCGFKSYDEVYEICPKCLLTGPYTPPPTDED